MGLRMPGVRMPGLRVGEDRYGVTSDPTRAEEGDGATDAGAPPRVDKSLIIRGKCSPNTENKPNTNLGI